MSRPRSHRSPSSTARAPRTDGRSSLQVSGKGALLPPVGLPLTLPVTVQASNSDGGCWAAALDASDPRARSDASTFKGRGD